MQEGRFPHDNPRDIEFLRDKDAVNERSVEEYPPMLVPQISEVLDQKRKASSSALREEVETIKEKLGTQTEAAQLSADLEEYNARLRELRIERKSVDTWAAKVFPAARARLMSLDTSLALVKAERDDIEQRLEAMLPEGQHVLSRSERVRAAKAKIGEELAAVLPKDRGLDRRGEVSPREQLRADRIALDAELTTLRFWQIGRKRQIAEDIKRIDREMARMINAERRR